MKKKEYFENILMSYSNIPCHIRYISCGWKIYHVVKYFMTWYGIFYHMCNGLERDFMSEVFES